MNISVHLLLKLTRAEELTLPEACMPQELTPPEACTPQQLQLLQLLYQQEKLSDAEFEEDSDYKDEEYI